ncbi:MAG: signal peptidase II [Pseudomonadota bacterium]
MKWFWISAVVLLLDQCSKLIAGAMLTFHDPVALIPFLNLRLAYNTGAAFSFLSNAGGWQRWFFAGVSLLVIAVLVVWMRRLKADQVRLALAFSLILGGAIGNLIDRLVYGHVIDFIDVYFQSWHWPTFNIADSAITIGAGLLLLDAWLTHRHSQKASRAKS